MYSLSIEDILNRLHSLDTELESVFDQLLREKREQFRYTPNKVKARFERGVKSLQKHQIPIVFLYISTTLYQHSCFRIYVISPAVRGNYILIDRHHRAKLNIIEKLNGAFCGYANGLIVSVGEIAVCAERYWCPVKHAQRMLRLSKRVVDLC